MDSQALLLKDSLFLPRSDQQFLARRPFPCKTTSSTLLPLLGRSSRHFQQLLHLPRNPRGQAVRVVQFDGPVMEIDEVSEMVDGDLVVESCISRTLPPALTLEQGLESISEAVEKLKLNPPSTASGFFRFRVAVPPSAKALNWFCVQPESSSVFPLFFVSKDDNNPSYQSLILNETRGVFGIGAAVYFKRDSSSASEDHTPTKIYFSNESIPVKAYGFVDVNFNKELTIMKHEAGSYHFFIPQIELDECEGVSILSATLAWCDSSLRTFEEAIYSFESSLVQARGHFWATAERCITRNIVSATLKKFNVVEERTVPMVYMSTLSPGGKQIVDDIKEMKEAPSSRQFCVRLSESVVVASNMLDHASEVGYSVQNCANINTLWASLIIEECYRLGLTYFCLAPGSRSTPLAVAASRHPHITCIACYDERSLAFHAVGYARGSRKPAIVITSSGTAVSNLLPAVVEASQDFVPLLLLTADRPPELSNCGANQAINQVNHFGSFVRFFYNLPAPTDNIPARMVLTTVDSAVHWATSSPYGPVHVNCQFREPLENTPREWMSNCLKGLDFWMSSAEPFTKYFEVQSSHAHNDAPREISEVLNAVQKVNKGLLVIGGIHTEDEMWAVLLMAKHLSWPIVADILSGLRLRKLLTSFPEIEKKILFVDHLDHALLSEIASEWIHVDAIIQIGSRITSKRVSKLLEKCSPNSYIMVDKHPFRYDPSHSVTHRIHSSIVEFCNHIRNVDFTHKSSGWRTYLRALNMMVGRELSFQISAENSLTEPQIAHIISEALSAENALFIGNSMAIRDADMYGPGWTRSSDSIAAMLNSELPCQLVRVEGNRGASGIDGLISTAVGFAVGCNKRVLCVLGDVSFLHDTNGLSILSQRTSRKPMTMLVTNNHGGAIFSQLPIASMVEKKILNQCFYTSHDISLRGLCMAHGVKHIEVRTKEELRDALYTSKDEELDCVIEVASSIETNAAFHSTLRKFARQAADHTSSFIGRLSVQDPILDVSSCCKVHTMEYSLFRIPLRAPPTMSTVNHEDTGFYREGFILSLSFEDGSVGFGEVSPMNTSREHLLDIEEQLRFLLHAIKGAEISSFLPLLKGSFSSWIWTNLGIQPSSLFPSVRCGLEMAILNALAARQGSDLVSLLHVQEDKKAISNKSSKVKICALVDSTGTPTEVADVAAALVEEGYAAIKLKVARHRSPVQDAEVIKEVRKKVGNHVELRVDANRNWTYQEAIQFGSLVKGCDLQYIEEPVKDEADIIKFCEESGLPVALDETIDSVQENPLDILANYTHPGIVAIVIKPSVVGGFEISALIAQWAQQHGKMAVISSTFESGLGLSAYIQFSSYLELKNAEICKLMDTKLAPSVAHGLGTYCWLKEDVSTTPLKISCNPNSGFVEASVADANQLLQSFEINRDIISRDFAGEEVREYQLPVDLNGASYSIKVQEIGQKSHDNIIVFLHGFLGTGEDWSAIMKAVSNGARCISIDLPGHGDTKIQNRGDNDARLKPLSIEVVADVIRKLLHQITPGKVTTVGYSMGGRIALNMAMRFHDKVNGAVVISGSPGLKDEEARKIRRAIDDSRAELLVGHGLDLFLDSWYAGEMWNSFRGHPKFNQIVANRGHSHEDVNSLAKVVSDSSIGRQLSLWEDLKHNKTPLLSIVGEKDDKFKKIAQQMRCEIGSSNDIYEIVEVPGCGHAVHIENPLPVIAALRQFLTKLKPTSKPN